MIHRSPLEQQTRARELGIVRIGEKVRTQNGGSRPAMRETFRITSESEEVLKAVQSVYPGELRKWEKGFELLTDAKELKTFVVPSRCFTEHMERWSGGGCTHRCDLVTCQTWDGDQPVEKACICDPQKPVCRLTTRLQFAIANVPLLGIWRLNSLGKIFSGELRATLDQMDSVGMGMQAVYTILSIRQQQIKKPGQPSRKFSIPTLTVDPNPPDFPKLLAGMTVTGRMALTQGAERPRIEAGTETRRLSAPVDDDEDYGNGDPDEGDEDSGSPRPPLTPVGAAGPGPTSALDCQAEGCGNGLTKAQAEYSKHHFGGRVICQECQRKEKEGRAS
jgi:hypothetical protein